MHQELADLLDYCRIERRLAPLTCCAYERDVGACIAFLQAEGLVTVGEVRPANLRPFLADEALSAPRSDPCRGLVGSRAPAPAGASGRLRHVQHASLRPIP